jgi:hypothetical protein
MIRKPAHKTNPDFDEGVKVGQIRLALEILDLINGDDKFELSDSFHDLCYLLDEIREVARAAIPD